MSGDVQPRKRKDKRRKKADGDYIIQRIRGASFDEEDAGTPPPTLINPSENIENLAIHIHKESSTGGHWCARILFFTLSAVLIGLIGIIIFEYRGATDVDTPIVSSKWAMIFDGWVDESISQNDDHEDQSADHEEDEENSEDDEDHDEGLGDEESLQEEDEDGDEDEDETNKDSEPSTEEEEEVDYEESEEREKESPDEGEMLDNSEDNQEIDDEGYEEDEDFEENEESSVLEDIDNNSEDEPDVSLEGVKASKEKLNDEIDESDDSIEEPDEEEPDIDDLDDSEEKEEEKEEESSSVAVKLGVGVALAIAAHFVLVKRWNNGDHDIAEKLIGIEDLPRRHASHNKQFSTKKSTQEPPNKKQAQNYDDIRAKYKTLGSDDNLENVVVKKVANLQAEKLIQFKEEPNVQTKTKSALEDDYVDSSEGEIFTDSEELDDEEVDEEMEEEEEEEEEDDEEEEEEELEDIDDSELVAKLEAKYGKLPTPTESDGDEEEEEEEEKEEKDEDVKRWKRVKAPPEATQKVSMEVDTILNSSKAVPQKIYVANASNSGDLTTSEELRNSHLKDI